MALGIIDWGIGGISIYKLIKKRRPNVPVVYFSDTGATPYGKMSRAQLVSRLNDVVRFLASKDVTHLVVGCNAASTAIAHLTTKEMAVEGVIESAIETTLKMRPRHLGVIGGRRTILSGVYRDAFKKRGIDVNQRIAQPLSGLVESGDVGSQQLRSEVARILRPLKNCSHVLLACTHYPAIQPVLKEHLADGVELIDPASAVVDKIERWKIKGRGSDVFLTSGRRHAMKRAAMAAFGCELSSVEHVRYDRIGRALTTATRQPKV